MKRKRLKRVSRVVEFRLLFLVPFSVSIFRFQAVPASVTSVKSFSEVLSERVNFSNLFKWLLSCASLHRALLKLCWRLENNDARLILCRKLNGTTTWEKLSTFFPKANTNFPNFSELCSEVKESYRRLHLPVNEPVQYMFSRDVKLLSFRFSRPNVECSA